jgi:hypothetical protein
LLRLWPHLCRINEETACIARMLCVITLALIVTFEFARSVKIMWNCED